MTGYSIFTHAQRPQAHDIEPAPQPQLTTAPKPQAEPKPPPKKRKKPERGWAVECGLGLFERKLLP